MAAKTKESNQTDKLQDFMIGIGAFFKRHRIRIYLGIGIFLLIILLVVGWQIYRLNYEKGASEMYGSILDKALKTGSANDEKATIEGYKELIASYPGSQAAIYAHYRLGNLYFRHRDFDAAITTYKVFVKKIDPESDLITLAYIGLGASFEEKKDLHKALEYYELASKTNSATSFESLNYGNIARIYEAMKQPQKASEFYRKALEKTTDPLMNLYLKRKLALLD